MMNVTPYDLYQYLETKGYIIPMAGQIAIESLTSPSPSYDGKPATRFVGTGDHLKSILETDRRAAFKAFYGEDTPTESTWLAGEEPGHGMLLPLWAERLIHAEMMVVQEKIETSIEYLIHAYSKQTEKK
jgi:hypothetical protein